MGFDLGGVVRTPTDSQPMAETETEGTISTSHESGIAIATPPEVESPVFLSDRMIENPGGRILFFYVTLYRLASGQEHCKFVLDHLQSGLS